MYQNYISTFPIPDEVEVDSRNADNSVLEFYYLYILALSVAGPGFPRDSCAINSTDVLIIIWPNIWQNGKTMKDIELRFVAWVSSTSCIC